MQLNELMERIHTVYPDQTTRDYWDPTTQRACAGSGDTLAEFIVREIADTYDETAGDEQQTAEAIRVMERARIDLGIVIDAIKTLADQANRLGKTMTHKQSQDTAEPELLVALTIRFERAAFARLSLAEVERSREAVEHMDVVELIRQRLYERRPQFESSVRVEVVSCR